MLIWARGKLRPWRAHRRADDDRGETVTFSVRTISGESHEAYIRTEEEQRLHETDHSALSAGEQAETSHQEFGVHVAPFGTGRLECARSSP